MERSGTAEPFEQTAHDERTAVAQDSEQDKKVIETAVSGPLIVVKSEPENSVTESIHASPSSLSRGPDPTAAVSSPSQSQQEDADITITAKRLAEQTFSPPEAAQVVDTRILLQRKPNSFSTYQTVTRTEPTSNVLQSPSNRVVGGPALILPNGTQISRSLTDATSPLAQELLYPEDSIAAAGGLLVRSDSSTSHKRIGPRLATVDTTPPLPWALETPSDLLSAQTTIQGGHLNIPLQRLHAQLSSTSVATTDPNQSNQPSRNRRSLRRGRTGEAHADADRDRVAFGTKIDEDHANYVLMYDMLTGIRIAVSRCEAKPPRETLQSADFGAAYKLAFDITGNELTPSSRYDFKFKDYAPWVFRHIREYFKVDAAEYLVSLTGRYVLSELGSPGKSGSFFYFSQDYRFIIKTIHHSEHQFMRAILPKYYEHVRNNPNTLISRFFGLHRVKLPRGRKIHFVVMGNVFPPNKDVHEIYDLKGSTVGRMVDKNEVANNPRVVMKDLNWLERKRRMLLGPDKQALFLDQAEKDSKFLASLHIMDYSLLVGIHYFSRGNSENIRDKSLSVFEPNTQSLPAPVTSNVDQLYLMRQAIVHSDPVALGPSSSRLPDELPTERRNCIFYQDDGGFAGADDLNRPTDCLYYIGIIDILTPYNFVKRFEHLFKSIHHDKTHISSIDPLSYSKRFNDFMRHGVTGPIQADTQWAEASRRGSVEASGSRGLLDPSAIGPPLLKTEAAAIMQQIQLQQQSLVGSPLMTVPSGQELQWTGREEGTELKQMDVSNAA